MRTPVARQQISRPSEANRSPRLAAAFRGKVGLDAAEVAPLDARLETGVAVLLHGAGDLAERPVGANAAHERELDHLSFRSVPRTR